MPDILTTYIPPQTKQKPTKEVIKSNAQEKTGQSIHKDKSPRNYIILNYLHKVVIILDKSGAKLEGILDSYVDAFLVLKNVHLEFHGSVERVSKLLLDRQSIEMIYAAEDSEEWQIVNKNKQA